MEPPQTGQQIQCDWAGNGSLSCYRPGNRVVVGQIIRYETMVVIDLPAIRAYRRIQEFISIIKGH